MRRAAYILAAAVAIAVAAYAVEPTGSSFPGAADDFQAVQKMDTWTAAHHNRLLDAVNEMQDVLLLSGTEETACAEFSVQPAARKVVNIPLALTTTGAEPAFCSAHDDDTPNRVTADGVGDLVGTVGQCWVFNHDATNGRTGKVCIQVVRGLE